MYAYLHSLSSIGGGYKPYFAQGATKRRRGKYTEGEAKRNGEDDSFGVALLPCVESVCLIKGLSA